MKAVLVSWFVKLGIAVEIGVSRSFTDNELYDSRFMIYLN